MSDNSASVADIDQRNAASAMSDNSDLVDDIDSRNAASAFGGWIGPEPRGHQQAQRRIGHGGQEYTSCFSPSKLFEIYDNIRE